MFKQSKKAQIGEVLHDSTAFIVTFFLVVLLLIISLLFASNNTKIMQENAFYIQDKIRASTVLDNLLEKKTSVELNNNIQEISFKELAMLAQSDSKYNNNLAAFSKEIEDFCVENNKRGTRSCSLVIQPTGKCPDPSEISFLACVLLPSTPPIAIVLLNTYKTV